MRATCLFGRVGGVSYRGQWPTSIDHELIPIFDHICQHPCPCDCPTRLGPRPLPSSTLFLSATPADAQGPSRHTWVLHLRILLLLFPFSPSSRGLPIPTPLSIRKSLPLQAEAALQLLTALSLILIQNLAPARTLLATTSLRTRSFGTTSDSFPPHPDLVLDGYKPPVSVPPRSPVHAPIVFRLRT